MRPNNRDEKRRRQERTVARKCKERSEYREKYKEQNQQEDELRDHNLKLESSIKKGEILSLIIFIWNFIFFVFLALSFRLWPELILLNLILSILFIVSVCTGMLVFANFMSRCQFYISLAERPIVPCGVRIPVYQVDRVRHFWEEDLFEEMNKEDVFTHCSAKQIVITNDPHNGSWLILIISSFVLLYFSLCHDGDFWAGDSWLGILISLVCLLFAVFFYAYSRKKTFIIDREKKTITIPPVSSFGKSKEVPWQQVVVAYSLGIVSFRKVGRCGSITKDYLALTTKDSLPYATRLGFRCDSLTQYGFAWLICEYMNVPDLEDMPDIKGFEDIIERIKAK